MLHTTYFLNTDAAAAMSNCEHVMEGPHQHACSPTNIWTKRSTSHNFQDGDMTGTVNHFSILLGHTKLKVILPFVLRISTYYLQTLVA